MAAHQMHLGTREAVLYPDCARCLEHAEHIVTMDDAALRRLMALVYRVERQDADTYRNAVEAKAGRQIWQVALAISRTFLIPLRTLLLGEIEGADLVRQGFDG